MQMNLPIPPGFHNIPIRIGLVGVNGDGTLVESWEHNCSYASWNHIDCIKSITNNAYDDIEKFGIP